MNVITAVFGGGSRFCTTRSVFQIDKGDVLRFVGLDLPQYYEVHFANAKNELAMRVIATGDSVVIPWEYMRHGKKEIYAWIYLTPDAETGYTPYQVTIPLNPRSDVSDVEPTPEQEGIIGQAIAALNDGVERAENAADAAEDYAGDAETAKNAAEAAQEAAQNAAGAAAESKTAAEASAGTAAQAASNAANSADQAAMSAGSASDSAADAATSMSNAAQSAAAAGVAASTAGNAKIAAQAAQAAAETARAGAEAAENAAGQSAAAAALSKQAAAASESNAAGSERQAGAAAAAAATSAHNAGLSETAAHDYAEDAEGSAASAATSAASAASAASTAIQQINAAGVAQVQAVEDKGEEVLDSIPPDYSALVSDVEAIEAELDGVATEATAQQTLAAEDDGAFWLGRVLMVMDGLADDLIAMVEAEIAKLPQDENGQAIAASIGEGNSWLNMLYHELEVE